MMEIRTDTITLGERQLVISEANHRMARKARQMEQEAETHPSTDPMDIYMDAIYPSLCAYSEGEVPTKAEALQMALERPQEFDAWYCAVRKLNPAKFRMNGHNPDADEKREVVFRDGSKITVINSYNHPSFLFKAQQIHDEVIRDYQNDDLEMIAFYATFYPAMAACSTGNVPGVDEADKWPETELSKWYEACREENPSLFPGVVTDAEQATVTTEQESKKKMKPSKRPRKS